MNTVTYDIYTLSLHDALPIFDLEVNAAKAVKADQTLSSPEKILKIIMGQNQHELRKEKMIEEDRKSTRLNSSHVAISYAVFCLKKKKIHYCTINEHT